MVAQNTENKKPEAPLIKTGPGGDYVKEISGDDVNQAIDKTIQSIGQALIELGNSLISVIKNRCDDKNS